GGGVEDELGVGDGPDAGEVEAKVRVAVGSAAAPVALDDEVGGRAVVGRGRAALDVGVGLGRHVACGGGADRELQHGAGGLGGVLTRAVEDVGAVPVDAVDPQRQHAVTRHLGQDGGGDVDLGGRALHRPPLAEHGGIGGGFVVPRDGGFSPRIAAHALDPV